MLGFLGVRFGLSRYDVRNKKIFKSAVFEVQLHAHLIEIEARLTWPRKACTACRSLDIRTLRGGNGGFSSERGF